jgi:SAM-dependent methyltransferase
MTERKGIYNILKSASVYNLWHTCIGVDRAYRTFVQEYLKPAPNDKILDLGCGTGNFCRFLPESVGYMGCDINAGYIEAASMMYPKRGPFWQGGWGRGEAIVPVDTPCDYTVVLSMGVGHHLDKTEFQLLMEAAHYLVADSTIPARFVMYDCCLTKRQSQFSRWLTLQDRGRYPRPYEFYLSMLNENFSSVQAVVRTDLYRLPWSIIIAEAIL